MHLNKTPGTPPVGDRLVGQEVGMNGGRPVPNSLISLGTNSTSSPGYPDRMTNKRGHGCDAGFFEMGGAVMVSGGLLHNQICLSRPIRRNALARGPPHITHP